MARRHHSKQQVWWLEQKAKSSHHEWQVGSSERKLQVGQVLKLPKATSDDILPLGRPSLLNLLEHYHQLETRNSNAGDYGGHSYANHQTLRTTLASWDAWCLSGCVHIHSCWHPPFRAASCSYFHSVPSLDLPELHRLFSSSQFNVVLKTFIFLFLYSKLLANCKLLAFPIKWYCNQLSIFLQALFVLRFLNSEPFVVTDSSNFILTAGFSKLLMPTSIAYTPKVQLVYH